MACCKRPRCWCYVILRQNYMSRPQVNHILQDRKSVANETFMYNTTSWLVPMGETSKSVLYLVVFQ